MYGHGFFFSNFFMHNIAKHWLIYNIMNERVMWFIKRDIFFICQDKPESFFTNSLNCAAYTPTIKCPSKRTLGKLRYYESVNKASSFVKVYAFANFCNSLTFLLVFSINALTLKSKLIFPSRCIPSSFFQSLFRSLIVWKVYSLCFKEVSQYENVK